VVSEKSRINSTRVIVLGFSNKSNLEWKEEDLTVLLSNLAEGTKIADIVIGVIRTTIMSQGARTEVSIGMRDIGRIDTEGTDNERVVDERTDIERVVVERTDIEAADIVRKHVERTDTEMMTATAEEEGILVLLSRNFLPSFISLRVDALVI